MKVAPPTNHWRHQTLITAALSMLSLLLNPRPGVFSTTYPFAVRSNLHILFAPPPPSSQHDNRNLFVHPPFPSSPTLPSFFSMQLRSALHYSSFHTAKKKQLGEEECLIPFSFPRRWLGSCYKWRWGKRRRKEGSWDCRKDHKRVFCRENTEPRRRVPIASAQRAFCFVG